MKFKLVKLFFVSFVWIITSCSPDADTIAQVKKADSLRVVLNSKLASLKQSDSSLISRAVNKFNTYTVFIQSNLNDTIEKTEANFLQQFYLSGNNLIAFHKNRNTLIVRAHLILIQIENLSKDFENKAITAAVLKEQVTKEELAAREVIQLIETQLNNYNTSIQDFKNALLPVENLLKKKNNGILPAAVSDTVTI